MQIYKKIKKAAEVKREKSCVKLISRVISGILIIAITGVIIMVGMNRIVISENSDRFVTVSEAISLEDVDCILVLGAGVYSNKYPSAMLEDRLLEGINLYQLGVSDRILMSGDNSKVHYNEVKVMKDFAIKSGILSEHVFQDHAGFSTYESMYRARDVFAAKKIVIVTQDYHMYRALYIAKALGLDAYGVVSNPRMYAGQAIRDFREILARAKDVFYCTIKPLPTFLGDVIPVNGNGNLTD